jgi:hypothetical protein
MASLYNADLKPLAPGVATHPYDHATKLFVADNMRLAPKQSFLYYVVINMDIGILQTAFASSSILADPVSSQTLIEQYETGLLAKAVELPKFTMGTKTLNAYNRKNIVQTHIQYDPINITFHDDAADTVTKFWNDYYTYYFRDSDYDATLYQTAHKYQSRLREGWGYSPRNGNTKAFLRNIQIFSLHNKRFTEYLLVNPFISSWRHGEHRSSDSAGTMENSMTITYESVKYRTGYVNPVDVNGFSILHYDNYNSPISTSTTNIYTDGGIIGTIAGASTDLARPDGTGSGQGLLSNILNAYRFYNNLKGANYGTILKTSLASIGASAINGAINGAINSAFFPTTSGTAGYGGTYGSSQVYQQAGVSSYPYAMPGYGAGVTVGGVVAGAAAGAAINSVTQTTNQWAQGIAGYNQPYNPAAGRIYDVAQTNGTIAIDPKTGQPYTGSTTATVTDDQGKVLSQFTTTGTQNGTFNPNNPSENLVNIQTTYDEGGNAVYVKKYRDGTQVIEDANGKQIGVYPGAANTYSANGNNPNPKNARDIAASTGKPPSAMVGQYYTDPKTGLTYTVNGNVAGQITNTITGATGAAAGLYAGQELSQYLNSTALGKTVLGRTIATGTSAAVGAAVGKAVNNGLQPIVNSATGYIALGFDKAAGEIKSVVGTWFGSGGYDATNPTTNLVSVGAADSNGNQLYTYKDGTKVTLDAFGDKVSETPGSSGWSFGGVFGGSTGQNTDTSQLSTGPGSIFTDSQGNPVLTDTGSTTNINTVDYGNALYNNNGFQDATNTNYDYTDSGANSDTWA